MDVPVKKHWDEFCSTLSYCFSFTKFHCVFWNVYAQTLKMSFDSHFCRVTWAASSQWSRTCLAGMRAVCLLHTLAQTTESLLSLGLLVLKLKLSLACHQGIINHSSVCCPFQTYRPSLPSQKAGCCRFSVGCVLCVRKLVLHNLRYKPKDATFLFAWCWVLLLYTYFFPMWAE